MKFAVLAALLATTSAVHLQQREQSALVTPASLAETKSLVKVQEGEDSEELVEDDAEDSAEYSDDDWSDWSDEDDEVTEGEEAPVLEENTAEVEEAPV